MIKYCLYFLLVFTVTSAFVETKTSQCKKHSDCAVGCKKAGESPNCYLKTEVKMAGDDKNCVVPIGGLMCGCDKTCGYMLPKEMEQNN